MKNMKKNILIIALAGGLVLIGYFAYRQISEFTATVTPVVDETKGYDSLAEDWIRENAWTYRYDGSDLMLKISSPCPDEDRCLELSYTFESAHGGYGDRRDKVLTQVITPHTVVIIIRDATVVSAITDGKFDEIKQQLSPQTSVNPM